jgi:hypothetical protein
MRKVIVTMGVGDQARLLRLMMATAMPYASRHGYDVKVVPDILDSARPPAWSKILALKQLHTSYDLLLWLDADLMVVEREADIARELEPDRSIYLAVHRTSEGELPNTGVLMLRADSDSAAFLDEVWAQQDLVDHRWWENAAVARLLGYDLDPPRRARETEWLEKTKFVDGRWNSIRDAPSKGARIRHYPGYRNRTRAAFMARDLASTVARDALRSARRRIR